MLEWLIKFQKMDRRWVFLGMALAILIPLLLPIKLLHLLHLLVVWEFLTSK